LPGITGWAMQDASSVKEKSLLLGPSMPTPVMLSEASPVFIRPTSCGEKPKLTRGRLNETVGCGVAPSASSATNASDAARDHGQLVHVF